MKSWQNGWERVGTRIAFGCAGCGKWIPACYVVSENMPPPPEYPFEEGDCPVCELQEKYFGLLGKFDSKEDKLTARMLKLKEKKGE